VIIKYIKEVKAKSFKLDKKIHDNKIHLNETTSK
jgi:hypothetical protein